MTFTMSSCLGNFCVFKSLLYFVSTSSSRVITEDMSLDQLRTPEDKGVKMATFDYHSPASVALGSVTSFIQMYLQRSSIWYQS